MPQRSSLTVVTGASGSVGQVVVRRLVAAGFAVRALSRRPAVSGGGVEWATLPPFDAPLGTFQTAIAGATHLIHGAGLTNADPDTSESDFMNANVRLTEKLAEAAAGDLPGRFVLFSSIRAVVGRGFSGTIDERTPAAPVGHYGRSKRGGEEAAFSCYGHRPSSLTVLRPAPVYGHGMRGNLARMMRLADTPLFLPLAGLHNRRSLLSADALARAAVHLLSEGRDFEPAYVVSDSTPASVPEIISAFRGGFGREPRLFYLPPKLLRVAAFVAGRGDAWQGLFAEEICDPQALAATGWRPEEDSLGGLTALARSRTIGIKC